MARAVLGVAGAVAGFFVGAPAQGFQIGYAVGSALDATVFAPTVQGPRLNEAQIMASTEGAPVARVYGTARVSTQMIWAAYFKETAKTESSGGKGGPKSTTYQYSGSFAVALCEGSAKATLGQVWADGKLLDLSKLTYRFYPGSETQMPDSLIESIEGSAWVSAYRGIAYIVFEDMPLGDYGNRYPQITAEVTKPIESDLTTENLVEGVCLIPGTGSFTYADEPYIRFAEIDSVAENVHTSSGRADLLESLDQLEASLPNCDTVSIVVSWFGDDLRCATCDIKPRIGLSAADQADAEWLPTQWEVAGLSATDVDTTSIVDGANAFGSTPDDESVKAAIAELNSRGKRVVFYPFVLMDIAPGNTLPNPYSNNAATNGQPEFPWRGRITCSPAAGYTGTVDKTGTAATQVDAFFDNTWGYENFILHYANLCDDAGGVDVFLIGSELKGLTQVRSGSATYPTVARLQALAAAVKAILPTTLVSYAADWSEYHSHRPSDGTGDVYFHLDPLWADSNIDFIGIDNYLPLTDHRLTSTQNIYDLGYLKAGIEAGEYYDWYYASDSDRTAGTRTAITDGAYDKPWVFRDKDLRNWWRNDHYNRPAGVESVTATDWTPGDKPIWFTEFGCPAINRGTNQPNVFSDQLSSESATPYFSTGIRDDLIQDRYLRAMIEYWRDNGVVLAVDGGSGGASYSDFLTATGASLGDNIAMSSLVRVSSDYEYDPARFENYSVVISSETAATGQFRFVVTRSLGGVGVDNTEVDEVAKLSVGEYVTAEFDDDPGTVYEFQIRTIFAKYIFVNASQNAISLAFGADIVGFSDSGTAFSDRMIEPENMIVWTWDARPYPAFPLLTSVWADGANYQTGHWINGRLGATNSLGDLIQEICSRTIDATKIDTSLVVGAGIGVDGYYVTQISSPRDDLAPLLSVYSIDVHESAGVIKFVHRSVAQTLEVDEGDMVPSSSGDIGYKISRTMSYELPSSYVLTYMDQSNAYQSGSVSGMIEGSNTPGMMSANYPLVMTEAQAKALADTLVYGAYAARESIGFALPPSLSALEPGDIITMTNRESGFLLSRSSFGDSLRFEGIGVDPSIYQSVAGSSSSGYGGGAVNIYGPVLVEFMDLPIINDDTADAQAPKLAAAANPWSGGAAVYKANNSGGYDLFKVVTQQSIMGELTDDLAASDPWVWDDVTELKIRLYGDQPLVSLDDDDVIAGENIILVQSPSGLWEAIGFADAELTDDREYTLTRLLRGRFGTEIEMREAPYPTGSRVVIYDASAQVSLPLSANDRGIAYTYRVGPYLYAQDHMTFSQVTYTSEAVGLRPYAPYDLDINIDVDDDIELFWTRRTRFNGDDLNISSAVPPLNEEEELYEVEIMSLDGTTVVRTVSGLGSPAWRYTATLQTADFGAPITDPVFRVYQISATVGRGAMAVYP